MKPLELIEAARVLTESGPGRPTQARLRRAVSTAYYAVFHCLAATAADLFIGPTRGPAWHRAYRALEHGRARRACQEPAVREFPEEVRDFAEAFVAMQKARQRADYALDTDDYQESDVLVYIAAAELAIGQFEQVDIEARRGFAALALFRQRPS